MNVYKSGLSDNNNRVLITLFIPVRAKTNIFRKNIINKLYAKYRTDLALVVSIVDDNYTQYIKARSAFYNETIIYKIGSLIKSEFNPNINIVNGKGIHFFIDRNIALNYGRPILEQKWIHNYINTPNLYQSFYSNGSLKERIKYTLKDNKILNEHVEVWYENGYRKFIDNYILGKKNGISYDWYSNGQLKTSCSYIDNQKHGLEKNYYNNGNRDSYISYDEGILSGIYIEWSENGYLKEESIYYNGEREIINLFNEENKERRKEKSKLRIINDIKKNRNIY